MVRKYIRKTERKQYTEEQMTGAVSAVLSGQSIRSMAKQYNISMQTLTRKVQLVKKDKAKLGEIEVCKIQTTFTLEQEDDLIDYVNSLMEKRNGLSMLEFRKIAFEFADQNSIKNRFNERLRMAGHDFASNFLKRHPSFKLKKRMNGAQRRETLNGKKCVENYFTKLDKVMLQYMFEPSDIFHCGQLALNCIKTSDRVFCRDGNTEIESRRPQLVTVICCASSTGFALPPVFMFPRSHMKDSLLDHAPLGSIGFSTESGRIEDFVVLRFLEHFVKHTRCSTQRKVLLLVSGHVAPHLNNLNMDNFATLNGIVHITIPPHTIHYLHPLHKSLFRPLRQAYDAACKVWMRRHSFRNITDREVPEVFNTAYNKVLTLSNITDGFISCGVCPFNPDAEPDAFKLELEADIDNKIVQDEIQDIPFIEDIDEQTPVCQIGLTNVSAGLNRDNSGNMRNNIAQGYADFHNNALEFL